MAGFALTPEGINFGAVVILIFAMVWLNAYSALHESGRYRWISVGTGAVARSVLDYSLCWKAYYPE
jgi:hypothetical protein